MRLPGTPPPVHSSRIRLLSLFLAVISLALLPAGSALGRQAGTPASAHDARANAAAQPGFDAAKFSRPTAVDNPWLFLKPGTQSVYQGSTIEEGKRVHHRFVSVVTDLTKEIAGVRTVVVWDRDYSAGELVEAELAFFAQDDEGNVWELGEYPEEYENGKVVKAPSWIHGLRGARAGFTMKADPRAGTPSYSLGWGPAVGFTDRARIFKAGEKTCTPARCYKGVLVVDEFNPDQPGKHQLKYYARGVGNVRVGWTGAKEDSKETLILVVGARLSPQAVAQARAGALKLEASAYRTSKSMYGHTEPAEVQTSN
jgi:hypothetical protein